jgi:predicted ATPase
MRGPNPFTPWSAGNADFIGRKPEMDMYGSYIKEIAGGRPELLLVSGAPGIGKSALLRRFSSESEKTRLFAPLLACGEGERFEPFLSRAASALVGYAEEKASEGMLTERTLSSLKGAAGGEESFLSFCRMATRQAEGAIMLIDNVDSLRDPGALSSFLTTMTKAAIAERLRLGFVASFTEGFAGFRGTGREIRLAPFDEHGIREMVESALKKGPPKMGEECLHSIVNESEGNPYVAKTICYVIYDRLPEREKIITQRHYLTYYPAIMGTLSREFFDRLYLGLPPSEREVLAAFARAGKPANISDIARAVGKRHATTLALRLVSRGQLLRLDRGLYKVFTKLYGRYVLQRG